ncbi:MAG: DUF4330 domain-containing protein [Clostridiales bacterium]|jgi:hypothetical protein|nr:DUF4330 domain-containing protein [Clostridiales bacterium]
MMIIDKQGRIAGKVSVIDLALLIILLGLAAGFLYRQFSVTKTVQLANAKFYVTLAVEPVREYSIDAIAVEDVFYEQYATQSMGKVVAIDKLEAKEIIKKTNGEPLYVSMEDKYRLLITLECSGIVRDTGYFVNGNTQLSEGSDLRVQSNKVFCAARVETISETI